MTSRHNEHVDLFTVCPMCSTTWRTRDDVPADHHLITNGYGADFETLEYGLFHVPHHVEHCHSTMAIQTTYFLDLYSGKRYEQRQPGQDDCPGFCLDANMLRRCDALCECSFVREVTAATGMRQASGIPARYAHPPP